MLQFRIWERTGRTKIMWKGSYCDVTDTLFGRSKERYYMFSSLVILSHSAALCSPTLVPAAQRKQRRYCKSLLKYSLFLQEGAMYFCRNVISITWLSISKGYSIFIKQQSKYLLKAWSNSSVHNAGPIQCTVTYIELLCFRNYMLFICLEFCAQNCFYK